MAKYKHPQLKDAPDLKTLQTWAAESMFVHSEWRKESWRDCEMYDGGQGQWTQEDWDQAKAAKINPITINRTFPILNLILGSQVVNKFQIIAKGRTQDDAETSQVMSEAIAFVMDQNDGEFLLTEAFQDSIIPGVGLLHPGLNSDPRREKIKVAHCDWKNFWWDAYGKPWFSTENTRYVFYAPWTDLRNLQALFPEHKKDLQDCFEDLSTGGKYDSESLVGSLMLDEGYQAEEYRRMLAGTEWVDAHRKRCRPIEMWYTTWSKAWFVVFPNGHVAELNENTDPREQYAMVEQSSEVVAAHVRKVNTCTFLGDLILQHRPSPYPHDQFPYIPFVGYIDRWGFPYGIPRQIRGQDEEVNKRRSMALALLKARRVVMETDIVEKADEAKLQALYEEAQKLDGFLLVNPGAVGQKKIQIMEQGELASSQIALLEQSEREMNEMVGANEDRRGEESNATSGKAIEKRQAAGATMTAKVFDNLRRSMKLLGYQLACNIQGFWNGEKVLRITDRLSGKDRFVALNEPVQGPHGEIRLKNNITQGKYDLIITESPQTDTVREKNLELVIEWVKKSPPEIIPHLIHMAFEMSNLPNKDQLMAKIGPILGTDPRDEDLSPMELKQKVVQELEAQAQAQQEAAEMERQGIQLDLENKQLENEKLRAEIATEVGKGKLERAKVLHSMRQDGAKTKREAYRVVSDAENKKVENLAKWREQFIRMQEAKKKEGEKPKEKTQTGGAGK